VKALNDYQARPHDPDQIWISIKYSLPSPFVIQQFGIKEGNEEKKSQLASQTDRLSTSQMASGEMIGI